MLLLLSPSFGFLSSRKQQQQQQNHHQRLLSRGDDNNHNNNITIINNKKNWIRTTLLVFRRLITVCICIPICITSVYCLIASPPLHFFYETLPHAGPNSVYVPGSGFAGFWYHLGLFHSLLDDTHFQRSINNNINNVTSSSSFINKDTNFYCYSSGCISLVLSTLDSHPKKSLITNTNTTRSTKTNTNTLDTVYESALKSQQLWIQGDISQYEIVKHFFNTTIIGPISTGQVQDDSIMKLLPRLHILITTSNGVQVKKAQNIHELVDLLIRTTWIPFVTGKGIGKLIEQKNYHNHIHHHQNHHEQWFLDGGFSRMIHPTCQYTVSVPITWKTTLHTLNPGMTRNNVLEMWDMGIADGMSNIYFNFKNHHHSKDGVQRQKKQDDTTYCMVNKNDNEDICMMVEQNDYYNKNHNNVVTVQKESLFSISWKNVASLFAYFGVGSGSSSFIVSKFIGQTTS